MSSLRKAAKSNSRVHKERGQLPHRKHLGPLEKHKDYKIRAQSQRRKQDVLRALKKKALEKNPDEFYFHMVNSRVKDGVHLDKAETKELSPEQIRLMHTQDIKYIMMKRQSDAKKIDKLKSSHHLIDVEARPRNTHTFFVDRQSQAKNFDVAKRLNTHKDLINRRYNRMTKESLRKQSIVTSPLDVHHFRNNVAARRSDYRELNKRIEREGKLLVLAQKMEMKRHLTTDKAPPAARIKPGTAQSAPVYQWRTERQK